MNEANRDAFIKKIALNSGAVVCALGLIAFFFFNSETHNLTFFQKSIATLVAFIGCYTALFIFFKNKKL
jgi:hypothetical protein